MTNLIDIDVSFQTVPVPTPPIAFDTVSVPLPTIGPFSFPEIRTPGLDVSLPSIDIPTVTLPIPDVFVGTQSKDLGSIGPFYLPSGVDAYLYPDYTTFTVPVVDWTFTAVTGVTLYGPYLSYSSLGPFSLPTVSLPDVTVFTINYNVGGQSFDLPDITLPAVDIPLPSIPEFDLPDIPVPTAARLTGIVHLIDPTTLSVLPTVNTDALTAFVTQFMPDGFIADPVAWTFEAVLSEAERRVGKGLLGRLATLGEAVLSYALDAETKQALAQYKEEQ